MITETYQMTASQCQALEALCAECKTVDGNTLPIYKHIISQTRPVPCYLLYDSKQRLKGFLSTFFFEDNAIEITLMVAPSHRKQGFATQLLQSILPMLSRKKISTLTFSAPAGQNDTWFKAHNLQYQKCEYEMLLTTKIPLPLNPRYSLRLANDRDIPHLCALNDACFTSKAENTTERFQHLLHDANYCLFVAYEENGPPIGKAHMHLQKDSVRLTDIAVFPEKQRQGIGSTLLAHGINQALLIHRHSIILEVETDNKEALALYTRFGFRLQNACDYWTFPSAQMNLA